MSSPHQPSSSSLRATLLGGFVAGTIDIGAASLISGLGPIRILKIVAGGLLGRSAFDGGPSIAALGMLLQWAMSILIAAIFVLAARRIPALPRNWIASGIAYGVVTYFVMNFVVVPLSALGNGTFPHFDPLKFGENMLAMIVFGLIVAYFARHIGNHSD